MFILNKFYKFLCTLLDEGSSYNLRGRGVATFLVFHQGVAGYRRRYAAQQLLPTRQMASSTSGLRVVCYHAGWPCTSYSSVG